MTLGPLNQTNKTQIINKSRDFAIPAPVIRQFKQKTASPIPSSSTYIKPPPANSNMKSFSASVSRTSYVVPKTAVNVQTIGEFLRFSISKLQIIIF